MKTMYSLLIYNKSIGYVGFKFYKYLYGEYNLTYIACKLIEK